MSKTKKEIRETIKRLKKYQYDVLVNVKLIPDPNWKLNPSRDMMWSEDDSIVFNFLEKRIQILERELEPTRGEKMTS